VRSAKGDEISRRNPRTAWGGWRSNGRKVRWREAGITGSARSGVQAERCNIRGWRPKSRSEPVDRAFVVAKKRVTIVERRDAGKREV
jgi:hypothetical protein